MKHFIYSMFIGLLLVGCKSTKTLQSSGMLDSRMSVKQIVKNHDKFQSKFTTLQGRLKVEYVQGERSETHTLTLRMGYDNTIWVNAFLNMVRVKITPDRVRFYNKLDKTYFDGDYALISELLGTDLRFENLQNLLLGEAVFDINPKAFKKLKHASAYKLTPKNSNPLFDLLYIINPAYFKLDAQQLSQSLEQNTLKIKYQSYQKINGLVIPQSLSIKAINTDEQTTLNLNIKSVILGQPLRFPFKIPKGFKAIKL
jgi:outer membrane biogenesis lipoprotein LolB|tara:strand:- start:5708 stop:6472 length:765 start_codon:yes stop_codon:yes gene_type:complete